jgi:hypothetical protein
MSDRPLPIPPGNWDSPYPSTAPDPETVNLVAVLNQMSSRLPQLISALDKLRNAIPGFARDTMLGEMPPGRWAAMVALLDTPAAILADLATLCRHQERQLER